MQTLQKKPNDWFGDQLKGTYGISKDFTANFDKSNPAMNIIQEKL